MEKFFLQHQKMYHDTGEGVIVAGSFRLARGLEERKSFHAFFFPFSSWWLLSGFRLGVMTDSA